MKMHSFTVVALAAATLLVSFPYSASADSNGPMSTIRRVGIAFNQGNMKGFVALCDSPATVLDDFPPHTWTGTTACADWASALEAGFKKNDVTSPTVVFGTPWHVAITGNVAYVVVPATLTFNQKGKPVKQSGSVFTVVLKKHANGWLMSSWAWADGPPH
jgi:ketosteroid isomerase-like protein